MRQLAGCLPRTRLQALLVVAVFGAGVRVLSLSSIPLVITNDGAGYLSWALQMMDGQAVELPPFRTPGYPLALAGWFALTGANPVTVQVLQHLAGILAALCLTGMVSSWVSPRWAAFWGCLFAADPVFLAFESYALTETLSLALLMGCCWLAVAAPRSRWFQAIGLGMLLGALCLVRPAFQVIVPLFVGSLLLPAPKPATVDRARRGLYGATALACFLAVVAPWMARNAARGIMGLSGSTSVYLWIGVNQAGLLHPPESVPATIREPFVRLVHPDPTNDAAMHRFLGTIQAWESPDRQRQLSQWARASILQRPADFAGAVLHAALWQLDVFLPSGFMPHNETRWLVRRAGLPGDREDATNFQFTASPRPLEQFATPWAPGPFGGYFRLWARNQPYLPIRVLFAGAAVAALVAASIRREWTVTAVLAGTMAYFTLHAVFLLHNGRYSLPCWGAWYLAPAYCSHLLDARRAQTSAATESGDLSP